MSWKATAAVKAIRDGLTRTEKLVLLILSDYHNEKTGQCNPPVKDLAEDSLMGVRRVQQVLTAMALETREPAPLIQIEGREGGRRSAQYWLLCIGDTPEKYAPLDFAPPPNHRSPQGRRNDAVTPEPPFAPGAKSPDSKVQQPKEEPQREPQVEPKDEPTRARKVPAFIKALILSEAEQGALTESFPLKSVPEELAKFNDYQRATGRGYSDHMAAFRNWLRRPSFDGRTNKTSGSIRADLPNQGTFGDYIAAKRAGLVVV